MSLLCCFVVLLSQTGKFVLRDHVRDRDQILDKLRVKVCIARPRSNFGQIARPGAQFYGIPPLGAQKAQKLRKIPMFLTRNSSVRRKRRGKRTKIAENSSLRRAKRTASRANFSVDFNLGQFANFPVW